MGIDPEWMARYQAMLAQGRQAIEDWMECLRIENAMDDPFEEE